jgi:hypothetical protein
LPHLRTPEAGDLAAAETIVPMPDLGITHRLSGGMNLWRMPLSELEPGDAQPQLIVWRHTSTGGGLATPEFVSDLETGGWS